MSVTGKITIGTLFEIGRNLNKVEEIVQNLIKVLQIQMVLH